MGTAASDAIIGAAMFTNNFVEKFYAISMRGTFSKFNGTVTEGPIQFGLAHADYSVTEIAEKLDADEANVRGDKIAQEQSRRLIRVAGMVQGAAQDEVMADGREVTIKLGFLLTNGTNIVLWARNKSGGSLSTGTIVQFNGTLFGRYV